MAQLRSVSFPGKLDGEFHKKSSFITAIRGFESWLRRLWCGFLKGCNNCESRFRRAWNSIDACEIMTRVY